ncbi:MAG: hypothetical protein Kow0069_11180 [Promethearchaeota archaeon]
MKKHKGDIKILKWMQTRKELKCFAVLSIMLLSSAWILFPVNSPEAASSPANGDAENQGGGSYGPGAAASYDPSKSYEWWNRSFSYRAPVMLNASRWDQKAQTVRLVVNFSTILESDLGYASGSYTFDPDSVRLVEYDANGDMVVVNDALQGDLKYVVPSRFFTVSDNLPTRPAFDESTNAWGILVWNLDGTTPAFTNRTYMVYFDVKENNDLPPPASSITWGGEVYARTDAYGSAQYGLFAGTYINRPYFFGPDGVSDNAQYPGSGNYRGTAVGDFNHDGKIEAATTGTNNYNLVLLYWNEGLSTWAVNTSLTVDTDGTRSEQLTAGDIDGDGWEELVGGNVYQDRLEIFDYNPAMGTFSYSPFQSGTDTYNPYALSTFDLDDDGTAELMYASRYTNTFYVVRYNHLSSTYEIWKTIPNALAGYDPVVSLVGDFDLDGKIELVLSGFSRFVYIYEWDNESANFVQEDFFDAGWPTGANGIFASDVLDWDRDGQFEMIVGTYRYGSGSYPSTYSLYLKVYEIKGPDVWPTGSGDYEWINASTYAEGQGSWRFADFDNDGNVEIVTGNRHGWMFGYGLSSPMPVWKTQDFRPANDNDWFGGFIGDNLDVFNRYTWREDRVYPLAYLGGGQMKTTDLYVHCFDTDRNYLPGQIVTVSNDTAESGYYSMTKTTDENGIAVFYGMNFTGYNITIQTPFYHYTRTEEVRGVVFNSVRHDEYFYTNITHVRTDFISDGGDLLTLGHVLFYNDSGMGSANLLANLTLDQNGGCDFYAPQQEKYYYKAFYHNPLYNPATTFLKSGEFWPITGTQSTVKFVESATPAGSGKYQVVHTIFANGTTSETSLGTNWIAWANITVQNVTTQLSSVDIKWMNKFGVWSDWPTSEFPKTSFSDPNNYNVQLNFLDSPFGHDVVYGLRAYVQFQNATWCWGNSTIVLQEAQNERFDVPLVKVPMSVVDEQGQFPNGMRVLITNSSGSFTTPIAELWTDESGNAYDENGNEFWYLKKDGITDEYNISMEFYGQPIPLRNKTLPGSQYAYVWNFNMTSKPTESLQWEVQIDTSEYSTNLVPISPATTDFSINYRNSFTLLVHLDVQTPSGPVQIDADQVILELQEKTTYRYLGQWVLKQNGTVGYYAITLNSSQIDMRGNYGYRAIVSASVQGYGGDPDPLVYDITVNPITTTLSFYDANMAQISDLELYWNDVENVSVLYLDTSINEPITGATVTYSWNYGTGVLYPVDGMSGYYTFAFNSTQAQNYGKHWIRVTAQKENYVSQVAIQLDITIHPIPTTINGRVDYYQKEDLVVYKTKAYNITLQYWDTHNDVGVERAQTAIYTWRQYTLDVENPELIDEGASAENLVDVGNGTYVLDFDTEFRSEGRYSFLVTLGHPNYEIKVAFIVMEIRPMVIQPDWTFLNESGFHLSRPKGEEIPISINLWDATNEVYLAGATVVLELPDGSTIDLEDFGNGTYSAEISTQQYEVFAIPYSFKATLRVSKENYTTVEKDVVITVDLPEIFPGMPTFYFVIIVGLVAAVVMTAVIYNAVQKARIPEVVKKLRAVASDIRKNKAISERAIEVSRLENVAMEFASLWEGIELDVYETFGLKAKKGKKAGRESAAEELEGPDQPATGAGEGGAR